MSHSLLPGLIRMKGNEEQVFSYLLHTFQITLQYSRRHGGVGAPELSAGDPAPNKRLHGQITQASGTKENPIGKQKAADSSVEVHKTRARRAVRRTRSTFGKEELKNLIGCPRRASRPPTSHLHPPTQARSLFDPSTVGIFTQEIGKDASELLFMEQH